MDLLGDFFGKLLGWDMVGGREAADNDITSGLVLFQDNSSVILFQNGVDRVIYQGGV